MLFERKKILELMKEYEVTLEELLLLDLAYEQDYAGLEQFFLVVEEKTLKNLANKGLIEDDFGSDAEFLDIRVTNDFKRIFYLEKEDSFFDLMAVYPTFGNIDGKSVPLKIPGKYEGKHYTFDELQTEYEKSVRGDINKHNEIIEIVKLANQLGNLNFTFRRFILDRCWLSFDINDLRAEIAKQQNGEKITKMVSI